MKKLLFFLEVLLITSFTFGQSSNVNNMSGLILYRPEKVDQYEDIIRDKLVGYWISLDENSILKISEKDEYNRYFVSGDFFPGVSKHGDNIILRLSKSKSNMSISLWYSCNYNQTSTSSSTGSYSIEVVYYSKDDHLVVGNPPIREVDKNGKESIVAPSYSSIGIYGKEFRRLK